MLHTPFYDPTKSYEENYEQGPFGEFKKALDTNHSELGKSTNNFLGQSVNSVFGIPAGPLLNSKFCEGAFRMGFDLCTYKTVRSQAYHCHPYPNVLAVQVEGDLTLEKASGELVADDTYEEPLSITNSFGVPSMPPEIWQADMKKALAAAGPGQVLIGSFQGTKKPGGTVEDFIQDHVLTARLVKETGVKIMETNLSCPNEGTSDLLCFDVERVGQIARAIKEEIGDIPLILKLAYFKDQDHLTKFVKEVGDIVQGLAAINTIPAAIVDEQGQQALPGEGRLRSGVCGTAIQWAGLEMVERLAILRDTLKMSYSIVGVGGVMSAEDFIAYRQAGADAVMSATGAMWNPLLAQEIQTVEIRD